jgi:hypothetical protein
MGLNIKGAWSEVSDDSARKPQEVTDGKYPPFTGGNTCGAFILIAMVPGYCFDGNTPFRHPDGMVENHEDIQKGDNPEPTKAPETISGLT